MCGVTMCKSVTKHVQIHDIKARQQGLMVLLGMVYHCMHGSGTKEVAIYLFCEEFMKQKKEEHGETGCDEKPIAPASSLCNFEQLGHTIQNLDLQWMDSEVYRILNNMWSLKPWSKNTQPCWALDSLRLHGNLKSSVRARAAMYVQNYSRKFGRGTDDWPELIDMDERVDQSTGTNVWRYQSPSWRPTDRVLTIFLNCPGGSGKSRVLEEVLKCAKLIFNTRTIVVTALSGVAATSIGGETLHSAVSSSKQIDAKDNSWANVRLLIIDEISLMTAAQATLLDEKLRAKENNVETKGHFFATGSDGLSRREP